MGEVILVCSGKGGVGKSTLGYYCSRALANRGKRVLFIEFDSGLRSIDTLAGLKDISIYHLGDILEGNCSPDEAICVCPGQSNLHIICAPTAAGDKLSGNVLQGILQRLKTIYDFIFLDAPAGIGYAFEIGAGVCDTAFVTVTCDKISVRDGALVNDMLKNRGKHTRLIINKFDKKDFFNQPFDDLDAVIDEVGAQLIGIVSQSSALHINATNGRFDPTEKATGEIVDIASRLLGEEVRLNIK